MQRIAAKDRSSKPIKTLPRWIVKTFFDIDDPEMCNRVMRLLALADAQLEEPANDPSGNEVIDEKQDSNSDQTVRNLKKKLGLEVHISKDDDVLCKYEEFMKARSGSNLSLKHSVSRLSQYLGYVEKIHGEDDPWNRLLDVNAARKFVVDMRRCKVKDATILTYAKTLVSACKAASERWSREKEFPQRRGYGEQAAINYWGDLQKPLCRNSLKQKYEQLAQGDDNAADIAKCHEYINDPENVKKLQDGFTYLSQFTKTKSCIKRADKIITTALDYYNVIIQFLGMSAMIKRAPRTEVLENVTIGSLKMPSCVKASV